MMFAGWLVAIFCVLTVGAVANRALAFMGFTLLAGGLLAATLHSTRMWRMLIGATAGAAASWLGYRFAIEDRLLPAVRGDDPLDILTRDYLGAVGVGLGALSIGVGGLLEAMRAQNEPGESPVVVRIALIAIGMFIAGAICAWAGVSAGISVVVTLATGCALAAMAWLRSERPLADFQPSP